MPSTLALAHALKTRLTDERTHSVLNLALPAVGEQMLNMLVGLADTFMVGHLGASAVAAVGLSNQAVMLVTTFFAAVATGVTALVARHIGARETGSAEGILGQGYLLGAALGLLGTVLSLALAVPIMIALRAPADVVIPGANYLSIVSTTFLLAAWMFIGNAALRGSGDTRSPMLVMLVVNVVNIAVAYLFIYGPGPFPQLGVEGSALGAAAGRGVGGLLVTGLLLRGRAIRRRSTSAVAEEQGAESALESGSAAAGVDKLRLRPRLLRPDVIPLRRILNIGLPAGAEQLMMRLGMITYATTVAALGTAAFAAHQIALQAESLSYMPGFGFAVAATTLVGQGLGAGDPGRARADTYQAYRLALVLMSFMGLIFFFFPEQIMSIFIEDPAVIRLGVWPLRLVAFSQPMLATMMVFAGALRGAGDTRATLGITAAGLWLVRVPLAFLLTPTLGLVGAWIAMGIDLNLRGLGMFLRFRSGKWAMIKV
jgi:MATE family multidrug resistance protein